MKEDKAALEANGGSWHDGSWKGNRSSSWRISRDAVDLMNDTLTDNINKMVGEDDVLWHLGDFAFARREDYVRKCEFYRYRIKCQNINIIWGNHDDKHQRHLIKHLFKECHTLHEVNVDGQFIILCHYAMAVWEASHRGSWQLYGHSHTSAEPWMDRYMKGRRSIDVGVDNAYKLFGEYRPFSFEDLQKIFGKRDGFSMDHHIPRNSKAPREEELQ